MPTARLCCCISCFPGEVANKNTALYTDCLGLSFRPRLKKGERTLEGGGCLSMGWSLESPIIPYNGANRVLND